MCSLPSPSYVLLTSQSGMPCAPKRWGTEAAKTKNQMGEKETRDRTEDEKEPQKREQRGIRKTKEGIKERWEEREIRSTSLILPVLTQPLRH